MKVIYVDEHDQEIGTGTISNAVDNGIIVRISRVFIINTKGELLIQKRSSAVLASPGKWDQSAAGHVDEGESYHQAALRELVEEMGISDVALHEVKKFYTEEKSDEKTRKRFNTLFKGTYNGAVTIDSNEVSDYRWVSFDKLEKEMISVPDKFTGSFIDTFNFYNE